jgi:hypothetical protein
VKLFRSALIISSLFSLSLMAGPRGGGGGGSRGGGGGGYRGGGGGFRGGGSYGGGFRGGYGGYYGGFRGGYYGGYGFRGYGFGLGFGYGYPYYYGAGYYDPYYYDPYYYAAPAATYVQPAAPVTYAAAPAATPAPYYRQADYFLIAFTDHTIRAAQSFQVVGDQLEWTPKEGGAVQRASLASVDKRFSEQINRDRRVKFALP